MIALVLSIGLSVATPCLSIEGELRGIESTLEARLGAEAEQMAEAAISLAPGCVDARLALIRTIDQQLEGASGIRALRLSQRHRSAVRGALELDPDNVDARTAQIGYLIHAPGVAGGDRRRAAILIEELRTIDHVAAAQMALDLARAEGGTDAIISALAGLVPLTPENAVLRSEHARRLILAGRYQEAEERVTSWPRSPWLDSEALYLRGALRALSGTESEQAESLLLAFIDTRPGDIHPPLPATASAWALIGLSRESAGRIDLARDAYRTALRDDPGNQRALDGLSRLD